MVNVIFTESFQKKLSKVRDGLLRERVLKHIERIALFPEVGKPMRNVRRGTREVHIPPFRLSYAYRGETVFLLDLYHKDWQ